MAENLGDYFIMDNYKIKFIYKSKPLYTLYFSDDKDYLLNESKKIIYFNTEREAVTIPLGGKRCS